MANETSSEKLLLFELSEKVEIIGLRNLAIARGRVEKFLWFGVLAFGILVTGYYSHKVVSEYMDNRLVTKVEQHQPIAELECHST
jgi:hypothetical protein